MRRDEKGEAVSGDFDIASITGEKRKIKDGFSLSGNERNPLFLNLRGEQFHDIGGLSGLDHIGDSRSFAKLDFDRDGWQDIALASINTPLVQLYHNDIGGSAEANASGKMLAVRFVGGNHTNQASSVWSNRDGIGAMVAVTLGSGSGDNGAAQQILREHRAGEGLAAQNSSTLLIGIGDRASVDGVSVRWPSGKRTRIDKVEAGTLLTAYENPSQSPNGEPFVLEPYKVTGKKKPVSTLTKNKGARKQLRLLNAMGEEKSKELMMYTTMATWCAVCKGELPQLKHLRSQFKSDVFGMFGIPADESEGPDKLESYVAEYQPAYELLTDLVADQLSSVQRHIQEELRLDALPATILTDNEGNVLRTMLGVPSVSEIRQFLAEARR